MKLRLQAKFYIVSCKAVLAALEIRFCIVRRNPRKDFEANYQFRAPGGAFEKGTRTLTLLLDETCLRCFNFWCLEILSQYETKLSSRKCISSWKWNSIRPPSVFPNFPKTFCIFKLFVVEAWHDFATRHGNWKRGKKVFCMLFWKIYDRIFD